MAQFTLLALDVAWTQAAAGDAVYEASNLQRRLRDSTC